MTIRGIYTVSLYGNVNRHVRPILLRRHGFLCTLGYPSSCLRDRGVQLADLVNQVPVQPNEHHALGLTCKHTPAQVTNEAGERRKNSLGLTAGGLDPMVLPSDRRQIRHHLRWRRDRTCRRVYAVGAPPIPEPQKVEGIHVELALLRQVHKHLSPDQHTPEARRYHCHHHHRLPFLHVPRAVPLISKASSS